MLQGGVDPSLILPEVTVSRKQLKQNHDIMKVYYFKVL